VKVISPVHRIWLFVFVTAAFLLVPGRSASAAQLVVGPNKTACPNAGFSEIQSAINAASPGDHIRVCAGTYPEQLSITKPLEIDAENGAILQPGPLVQNTTSLFDASPIAAAILVSDAVDVSIRGFIVDGSNSGISECAPDLIGVMFRNASGSIANSAVRKFSSSAALAGCQSGTGIFVQSGAGQTSSVTIENCAIHDFQKNGITGNELGTTVYIQRNVVTGIGATPGTAQNGIQIGFGAKGAIRHNIVSDNLYALCTDVATCQSVATDILVTQSDGVEVSGNRAGLSQVPIFIDGNHARVSKNQTFAASVFDDLRIEGRSAEIADNRLFNGAESAIFLMGNNSFVHDNEITDSSIGILEASGSTGNILIDNRFFATPIPVQDPASHSLAKMIQPMR
jgi:nitrous oxidase accessory protein NosD